MIKNLATNKLLGMSVLNSIYTFVCSFFVLNVHSSQVDIVSHEWHYGFDGIKNLQGITIMAKSKEGPPGGKEGMSERAAKIYRNFNAIAAVAMGGLAVIVPVGGVVFGGLAALDVAQAAGGEWARRAAKKKRLKKAQ